MPTNSPNYWSANWWANYKKYQGSAKAKKERAARNKARAAALKSGKVKKGDGKDIDHKKPLSQGGSKKLSNTRVLTAKSNRKKWAAIANKRKWKGYKKAPNIKKKV